MEKEKEPVSYTLNAECGFFTSKKEVKPVTDETTFAIESDEEEPKADDQR